IVQRQFADFINPRKIAAELFQSVKLDPHILITPESHRLHQRMKHKVANYNRAFGTVKARSRINRYDSPFVSLCAASLARAFRWRVPSFSRPASGTLPATLIPVVHYPRRRTRSGFRPSFLP